MQVTTRWTEEPTKVPDATPESHAFCQRMYPRIRRVLTLHTGSPDVAAELAADVVVKVLTRWSQVRRADNVDAYVLRIAVNAANSSYRRAAAERRALGRQAPPSGAQPDGAEAVALRRRLGGCRSGSARVDPALLRRPVGCRYRACHGVRGRNRQGAHRQGVASLRRAGFTNEGTRDE